MATRALRGAPAVLSTLGGCGGDEDDDGSEKSDGGKSPPSGWRAAVGDDGVLVQTFDDVVWESRVVADANLHTVACVGNLLGWAAGANGTIVHTADAGATWRRRDARTF